MNTASEIVSIPLNKLVASRLNVRKIGGQSIEDLAWQRQPHAPRRALTETMVDAASDLRVRFVGIETYLNAGGLLERDLFQPEHEGYLTGAAKLDRLTVENSKLLPRR